MCVLLAYSLYLWGPICIDAGTFVFVICMPALRGCFEIYTVYVCLYLYIYVYIYIIYAQYGYLYICLCLHIYVCILYVYRDIFIDVLIYSFRVKLQFNFDPAG